MDRRFKHGLSKLPEYEVWKKMRQRCSNPKDPSYADYGGRGITVCPAWQKSVVPFIEDMGRRPSPDHSIDRIDNNGAYDKNNCRWATKKEQSSNQRKNIIVDLGGEKLTLSEACRRYGMKIVTVAGRISAGWDLQRALTQPPRPWGR